MSLQQLLRQQQQSSLLSGVGDFAGPSDTSTSNTSNTSNTSSTNTSSNNTSSTDTTDAVAAFPMSNAAPTSPVSTPASLPVPPPLSLPVSTPTFSSLSSSPWSVDECFLKLHESDIDKSSTLDYVEYLDFLLDGGPYYNCPNPSTAFVEAALYEATTYASSPVSESASTSYRDFSIDNNLYEQFEDMACNIVCEGNIGGTGDGNLITSSPCCKEISSSTGSNRTILRYKDTEETYFLHVRTFCTKVAILLQNECSTTTPNGVVSPSNGPLVPPSQPTSIRQMPTVLSPSQSNIGQSTNSPSSHPSVPLIGITALTVLTSVSVVSVVGSLTLFVLLNRRHRRDRHKQLSSASYKEQRTYTNQSLSSSERSYSSTSSSTEGYDFHCDNHDDDYDNIDDKRSQMAHTGGYDDMYGHYSYTGPKNKTYDTTKDINSNGLSRQAQSTGNEKSSPFHSIMTLMTTVGSKASPSMLKPTLSNSDLTSDESTNEHSRIRTKSRSKSNNSSRDNSHCNCECPPSDKNRSDSYGKESLNCARCNCPRKTVNDDLLGPMSMTKDKLTSNGEYYNGVDVEAQHQQHNNNKNMSKSPSRGSMSPSPSFSGQAKQSAPSSPSLSASFHQVIVDEDEDDPFLKLFPVRTVSGGSGGSGNSRSRAGDSNTNKDFNLDELYQSRQANEQVVLVVGNQTPTSVASSLDNYGNRNGNSNYNIYITDDEYTTDEILQRATEFPRLTIKNSKTNRKNASDLNPNEPTQSSRNYNNNNKNNNNNNNNNNSNNGTRNNNDHKSNSNSFNKHPMDCGVGADYCDDNEYEYDDDSYSEYEHDDMYHTRGATSAHHSSSSKTNDDDDAWIGVALRSYDVLPTATDVPVVIAAIGDDYEHDEDYNKYHDLRHPQDCRVSPSPMNVDYDNIHSHQGQHVPHHASGRTAHRHSIGHSATENSAPYWDRNTEGSGATVSSHSKGHIVERRRNSAGDYYDCTDSSSHRAYPYHGAFPIKRQTSFSSCVSTTSSRKSVVFAPDVTTAVHVIPSRRHSAQDNYSRQSQRRPSHHQQQANHHPNDYHRHDGYQQQRRNSASSSRSLDHSRAESNSANRNDYDSIHRGRHKNQQQNLLHQKHQRQRQHQQRPSRYASYNHDDHDQYSSSSESSALSLTSQDDDEETYSSDNYTCTDNSSSDDDEDYDKIENTAVGDKNTKLKVDKDSHVEDNYKSDDDFDDDDDDDDDDDEGSSSGSSCDSDTTVVSHDSNDGDVEDD